MSTQALRLITSQIFQLLLPEMDNAWHAFWMLIALCVVAPVLSWAARLEKLENPESRSSPEAKCVIRLEPLAVECAIVAPVLS